jgi:hypothetical protein
MQISGLRDKCMPRNAGQKPGFAAQVPVQEFGLKTVQQRPTDVYYGSS